MTIVKYMFLADYVYLYSPIYISSRHRENSDYITVSRGRRDREQDSAPPEHMERSLHQPGVRRDSVRSQEGVTLEEE